MARKKKVDVVDEVVTEVPVERVKKSKFEYSLYAKLNGKEYEAETNNLDEALFALRPKVLYTALLVRVTKGNKTVSKYLYLKDARRMFINALTRFVFVRDVNIRLQYMSKSVYEHVKAEETAFATTRVPLTNSKDWNMKEHIERCLNVSNGWFHTGKNDGLRPYDDIVTPIIDVAFRSEGFDVKDILPYVDDIEQAYKSFLVKKFHPEWAKKYLLDDFIDEVVESSIIFDLVLVKDVNSVRPEVVALQDLAFCDQTDIMSGPICIKHQWTVPDLLSYKGKWKDDKIDEVITMAKASKLVSTATDREVKTPGKYIEVYELHGMLPESWLYDDGDPDKYVDQIQIINYYYAQDGSKNGITLYKGKSKKLGDKFKALKIDKVRSKGRACGRSIVERLFEPQVWNNYSAIKLKKMLDSAVNLLQTDSEEYGNKKISELKENTIIKHEPGRPLSRIDMGLQNTVPLDNLQTKSQNSARLLGSASEASLGKNPVSGTPFALQDLIVQQGEGIHQYRQGKIASFFSDVLYPDLILKYLVTSMNNEKKFSEELSLDDIQEIGESVATNKANAKIKEVFLSGGVVFKDQQATMTDTFKKNLSKSKRGFFDLIKADIKDIPIRVKINVAGKQKNLAKDADSLSKLISNMLANVEGIRSIPGISKAYNELIESVGLSPVDFTAILKPQTTEAPQQQPVQQEQPQLVA